MRMDKKTGKKSVSRIAAFFLLAAVTVSVPAGAPALVFAAESALSSEENGSNAGKLTSEQTDAKVEKKLIRM